MGGAFTRSRWSDSTAEEPSAATGCNGPPTARRSSSTPGEAQRTFVYITNANGTDLRRVAAGDDPVWGTHTQE